jgi:hypothetical protein
MRSRFGLALALGALVVTGCSVGEGATLGSGTTLAEGASGPPTLALAPDGDSAYVVWVEKEGELSNVVLATVTPDGKPLRPAVRVNAIPGDASTHDQAPPQVAVGPGGEIYVVWQRSTEVPGRMYPVSNLRFASSIDGGRSFSPTITVNDDAGGLPTSHSFHNVTVAADGTVYVAWLDGRAQEAARAGTAKDRMDRMDRMGGDRMGRMEGTRGEEGGKGVEGGEAVGGGAGEAMQGMKGMGGMEGMGGTQGGHGGGEGPGSEIRVASWHPGDAGFGASVRVDGNVCPCCRAALAVGPEGEVYVAWRKIFAGDVRDVVVARSADAGRSFSAPVAVHADGWVFPGCPHAGPSLAVDGDGRLYAAWYTGKEDRQGLYYAVSANGGESFGDPVTLLSDEFVPVSQARLAAGNGVVWAAWGDSRPDGKRVHVGRLDGGTVREAGEAEAGSIPSIAMVGARGAVTWKDEQTVRIRSVTMGR